MTAKEKEYIRHGRHQARTDLLWLAKNVLGMSKVNEHVHRPIANKLQSFTDAQGTDVWDENLQRFVYTPLASDPKDVTSLTGKRRKLILAPRSWFKTSINVIAHTIQWILNYPDVTILITHASGETAEKMLMFIKQQFWKNPKMRYLFPEFCPPATAKDWGTQKEFNIPSRRKWTTAPTVSIAGIESIRTGMHYHVMKFTDIVDEKNAATKDQCAKIKYSYGMSLNLLISPEYWVDIEGTTYSFEDLYVSTMDDYIKREKEGREQEFEIFRMGCWKRDVSTIGKDIEEYTPEEIDCPYLLDEAGKKISRFPEEWSYEKLEAMRTNPVLGEYLFASQQENNPVATSDQAFDWKDVRWKSADDIKRIPGTFAITTVDLGETQKKRSDPTVITTALVDRMNRKYVVDIQRGKFSPAEIIDRIFGAYMRFRPTKIKVEETGFARGLKNSIQAREQMLGLFLPLDFLPRDTQISKTERILNTLQPMFRSGMIYFSEGLSEDIKENLKNELMRFPRATHDDILDTLADLHQNEPVNGPLRPSLSMEQTYRRAQQLVFMRAEMLEDIYDLPKTDRDDSWSGVA